MSLAEVAALVEQAARGLGRGHKLGVVHRRLRPAKIFLDGSGIEESVGGQAPPWLAKILDFGLAKSTGTSGGPGTLDLPLDLLRYRSPEQLLGTGEVDPRSDLWALGVIAYEALAGRPPFEADTLAGLIGTVTTAKVTPPGVPGGGAEPEAEAFWRRALAPRPADRFGSAQEMAAALCRIGQAGVPRVYSDEAYAGTLRVAAAPAGPGPARAAPASEPPATVPIDGSEPKAPVPAEPRGRWRRGDTLRLEDERDAEPAD
ncbi:MAG: protein kinase, partial [Deltaproteobacteria bacterium]|nr:protein kinase [Deltaproteobacteria bacterium]